MTRAEEIREQMRRLSDEYAAAAGELARLEAERFRVVIFGSARIQPGDPTFEMVRDLACALGSLGIDIVTGGGPGLMDAANEGVRDARRAGIQSIGLPIDLPGSGECSNKHLDIKSEHRGFSTRLDEFMSLSHAVIVAPGGIGTLLELIYTWQMVQVRLIEPRAIVLLGREFWGGLMSWMRDQQAHREFLHPADLNLVSLADTQAEALDRIRPELEKFRTAKRRAGQQSEADAAEAMLAHVGKMQSDPGRREKLPGA